jgi:glutamate-5-semialdehyde dehydrogenase
MLAVMGQSAKRAARMLARTKSEQKDEALRRLAVVLWEDRQAILSANGMDLELGRQKGLTGALLDRLMLDETRLQGMIDSLIGIAELPDPVGEEFDHVVLENGLRLHKQRVPVGVLAVIYEARPNVTVDVTALALKTGNAVILRGGSESLRSNQALVKIIREVLESSGLPVDAVQFIDSPDRALGDRAAENARHD